MAVTLTVDQLRAAVRYGSTAAETEELTRILAYASEAVERYAPDGSDVAHNEACIRLSAYILDMPNASRSAGYANALQNSGAASMLLPYREHRAGAVSGAAVAAGTPSTTPSGGVSEARVLELLAEHAPPPAAGLDQAAVDERVEAALAAHAAVADAHHVKTPAYVLPAAAAGTRGGVQAVTNAIIDADTSTGIFGWGLAHMKRAATAAVSAIVPTWARRAANVDRLLPQPTGQAADAGKIAKLNSAGAAYILGDVPSGGLPSVRYASGINETFTSGVLIEPTNFQNIALVAGESVVVRVQAGSSSSTALRVDARQRFTGASSHTAMTGAVDLGLTSGADALDAFAGTFTATADGELDIALRPLFSGDPITGSYFATVEKVVLG